MKIVVDKTPAISYNTNCPRCEGIWRHSSVGRVSGSYPACHWFESSCRYQLDESCKAPCRRAAAGGPGGFPVSKASRVLRPVGQVVKTPPFHGGNMGSSPVRVTSSEIPLTAPFPPCGENCAGRGVSSLSGRDPLRWARVRGTEDRRRIASPRQKRGPAVVTTAGLFSLCCAAEPASGAPVGMAKEQLDGG